MDIENKKIPSTINKMENYLIKVKKFGGSSLATPEKIKAVALFIKSSFSKDNKLCVVVSAMGKTTDNLLKLAREVSNNPKARELDMLISCGERTSMALLAIALNDLGIKTLSLTGSQSGIITDENHSQAQIVEIRPQRLKNAFFNHDVVIVAGFQGVSLNKEITTLKRGGSDTTAIALAKALNAISCEIYSDVPGVMSADPGLISNPILIDSISWPQMTDMALYGAKVLAYDAALMAEQNEIKVTCAQTLNNETFTNIEKTSLDILQRKVISITHNSSVFEIQIEEPDLEKITDNFLLLIKQEKYKIYFSYDKINNYTNFIKNKFLGLITVHLSHNDIANKIFNICLKLLRKNDIQVKEALVANRQIYLIINDSLVKQSIGILHEELIYAR